MSLNGSFRVLTSERRHIHYLSICSFRVLTSERKITCSLNFKSFSFQFKFLFNTLLFNNLTYIWCTEWWEKVISIYQERDQHALCKSPDSLSIFTRGVSFWLKPNQKLKNSVFKFFCKLFGFSFLDFTWDLKQSVRNAFNGKIIY